MSNIISAKLEELKATFGSNRVQLVTDSTKRQSIVALAKPILKMDKARWAEKEYHPELLVGDKAGYQTRIIPIRGATHIGSTPFTNVQALGVQRAGVGNASAVSNEIDMNRLVVEHYSYIAFLDNPLKPMLEAEVIQSQFGSKEAFEKCAFITFETLDLGIAAGPVGMLRLTLAPTMEEQTAIMKGYTKFGYKRTVGADGTTTVDKNAPLVAQTFGPSKNIIFRGVLFVSDVVATTADGVELSAFETYRCGTNAETGEMLYQEGTYAQLERNANTAKSVQELQTQFAVDILKANVLNSSASSFAKDVETPVAEQPAFDVVSALKPELQKFLKENGFVPAQLAGKSVEELREMATEVVELNA